jgi:cathepsin B
MPYSKSSFVDQKSSECEIRCTNPNFGTSYIADKHFGSLSYTLPNDELQIQVEIITHGPVVAEMTVYEDLLYYSSGKINSNTTFKMTFSKKLIALGIYEHVVGEKIGTEVVKIIGWSSDESVTGKSDDDRVNYWIVVTSWGDEWGVKGSFKIVRGTNQCGIESKVRAGRTSPGLDKDEYLEIRAQPSPRSAERRSLLVAPIWFIIMSIINSVVLI